MTDPTFAEPELSEQVRDLAQRVGDLRDTLQLKFYTARRAMRLTVFAMVAGFLISFTLWARMQHDTTQREHERTSAAVTSCLNANESRKAIEDRFEQLIAQLGSLNTPTDPTAAAVRQQLIDHFTNDFRASMPAALQPRDCSERAATQPTLVQR